MAKKKKAPKKRVGNTSRKRSTRKPKKRSKKTVNRPKYKKNQMRARKSLSRSWDTIFGEDKKRNYPQRIMYYMLLFIPILIFHGFVSMFERTRGSKLRRFFFYFIYFPFMAIIILLVLLVYIYSYLIIGLVVSILSLYWTHLLSNNNGKWAEVYVKNTSLYKWAFKGRRATPTFKMKDVETNIPNGLVFFAIFLFLLALLGKVVYSG